MVGVKCIIVVKSEMRAWMTFSSENLNGICAVRSAPQSNYFFL